MVDEERVARLLERVTTDVDTLRDLNLRRQSTDADDATFLAAMKYEFITALEGCARVAHHIAVSEGWAAPDSNADAIVMLARHGVIDRELGSSLARAMGFRNILVHEYVEVDDGAVVANVDRLDDLDTFVTVVAAWIC